jgi:hypothetical protein
MSNGLYQGKFFEYFGGLSDTGLSEFPKGVLPAGLPGKCRSDPSGWKGPLCLNIPAFCQRKNWPWRKGWSYGRAGA